jgi:electron transport complex protein RnfG
MKDILTITFRLTVACLLAGLVMGATFIFTDKAKKHNEHANEQRAMLGLLAYSPQNPPPATLAMHRVYRYLVAEGEKMSMGYLLPTAPPAETDFIFVAIDLDGNFRETRPVSLEAAKAGEEGARQAALLAAVGPGTVVRYADQTIVVTDNGARQAYLLPGKFPGFKTFVSMLVALDRNFSVLGLEIMEHEEDPGLGAEIVQDYFKKQFAGKSFARLKQLAVVKTPLPAEYQKALEADKRGSLSQAEAAAIMAQYRDHDIYALSGATISSRAVTNGVRGIAGKFAYRLEILDRVLTEEGIGVAF